MKSFPEIERVCVSCEGLLLLLTEGGARVEMNVDRDHSGGVGCVLSKEVGQRRRRRKEKEKRKEERGKKGKGKREKGKGAE